MRLHKVNKILLVGAVVVAVVSLYGSFAWQDAKEGSSLALAWMATFLVGFPLVVYFAVVAIGAGKQVPHGRDFAGAIPSALYVFSFWIFSILFFRQYGDRGVLLNIGVPLVVSLLLSLGTSFAIAVIGVFVDDWKRWR